MSSLKTKSTPLENILRNEIDRHQGRISFAHFMELALYAPKLGYYMQERTLLGREGDFMTAPEISPLYATCLAKQCQQIFNELPADSAILELGAGSGGLAKDLLFALEKINALPRTYFIVEISPALQNQQKKLFEKTCPHLLSRIVWLNALPSAEEVSGVILANEVLDAMPIHRFYLSEQGIQELCVTWKNDQFAWLSTTPTHPTLLSYVTHLTKKYALPENYISEVNLGLPDFIASIAKTLKKGMILFIDYGYGQAEYYHPDRMQGTLMCYAQHQRDADPLTSVGLKDITAHVDFTAVAENAIKNGLTLSGFTTQAGFLLSLDLLLLSSSHSSFNIDQVQQTQAIKKLLLPSEMGEAFKVIGLSKQFNTTLKGFSLQPRQHDL